VLLKLLVTFYNKVKCLLVMEFFSERANKKRDREGEWALPAKGQTNPTQPETRAPAKGKKQNPAEKK